MPKISRRHIFASSIQGTDPASDSNDIEFNEPEPPIQECDRILGSYLRTWNQIEHSLFDIFYKLLGAHKTAALILISSGISNQTIREIILALAGQRLNENQALTLIDLFDKLKKATTKRNRIVHGSWQVHITINKDGPNTAEWERFYQPTDPRLLAQMHGKKKKQKVSDAHMFSVERLGKIADEASDLAKKLNEFCASTSVQPFPEPQPLESLSPQN